MSRIQDIFRDHADAYLKRHGAMVPDAHRKAIRAIINCRTGACGRHLYECPDCGQKHLANASCGNRHCPVCQNQKASQWIYRQQLRLLPCRYFLATFTLPPPLQELSLRYPREMYAALLEESASALRALEADNRFVGCKVAGFFSVLHTWGRQLQFHPHAHIVIPGGGLAEDRSRWVSANGDFLVHVRALSVMFRGKMKARLHALGLLDQVDPGIWSRDWVVHCKPVGDGRATMKYLGAYVFRVAISDARIAAYDGQTVTFKYQKVGSARWRKMTLDVLEFMRRFLLHVLPAGFVKVRHFGFLSPNFAVPLQRICELISMLHEMLRPGSPQLPTWQLVAPKKFRPVCCPKCRTPMRWIHFLFETAGLPRWRSAMSTA
jgi:hypothetical protein